MGVLVVLAGVVQGAVGWLGWRGGLRRNRFVGIRTAVAMASEDAFRLANRVAAPALLAAAAVAVLGGVAALAAPSAGAYAVVLGVAGTGMIGLMVAGGVLGTRAAAGLAPAGSPPVISGCANCTCASGINRCTS